MDLVVGIDGGGTSCRAAVATAAGTVIGRGRSGSANIMTDLRGARDNIVDAARNALLDAGLDGDRIGTACAVLGLAGANVGTYGQQLVDILPFAAVRVETDAMIALEGALGDHDGGVAIIGTGSAFMSRLGGCLRTVGGWGFLLGDFGSGARMGRDLLQETLLAHDGVRPASPLTVSALQRFDGDPQSIVSFAAASRPVDFGALAPMILEYADQGDAVGLAIVGRAVDDIESALSALHLPGDSRLCLLGGLAPLLSPRLSPRFASLLAPPIRDALGGAVEMAVRRFGQSGAVHA